MVHVSQIVGTVRRDGHRDGTGNDLNVPRQALAGEARIDHHSVSLTRADGLCHFRASDALVPRTAADATQSRSQAVELNQEVLAHRPGDVSNAGLRASSTKRHPTMAQRGTPWRPADSRIVIDGAGEQPGRSHRDVGAGGWAYSPGMNQMDLEAANARCGPVVPALVGERVTAWWGQHRHGRMAKRADDALLAAVRDAIREAEDVPPDFVEACRTAFAWHNIDAELAALTYDSLQDALADAETRSPPPSPQNRAA